MTIFFINYQYIVILTSALNIIKISEGRITYLLSGCVFIKSIAHRPMRPRPFRERLACPWCEGRWAPRRAMPSPDSEDSSWTQTCRRNTWTELKFNLFIFECANFFIIVQKLLGWTLLKVFHKTSDLCSTCAPWIFRHARLSFSPRFRDRPSPEVRSR